MPLPDASGSTGANRLNSDPCAALLEARDEAERLALSARVSEEAGERPVDLRQSLVEASERQRPERRRHEGLHLDLVAVDREA